MTRRDRLPRRPSGDRGAASLWVLAMGLLLVAAGLAAAAVGAARVARHQGRTAADLAALAGAARAVDGTPAACDRARRFASGNGGRLSSCVLDGWDIVVTVEVRVRAVPGFSGVATVTARAGPVATAW